MLKRLFHRLPKSGRTMALYLTTLILVVSATIKLGQEALQVCLTTETEWEKLSCLMTSNMFVMSSPVISGLSTLIPPDSSTDQGQSVTSAIESINTTFEPGVPDWRRTTPTTDSAQ
jgi:hypothetical protein